MLALVAFLLIRSICLFIHSLLLSSWYFSTSALLLFVLNLFSRSNLSRALFCLVGILLKIMKKIKKANTAMIIWPGYDLSLMYLERIER